MEKSRIENFEDSIRANPTDSFAHYVLAMEYEKAGRNEDAIAMYKRIVDFDPNYVPAYQMCGQLLIKLGRNGEAREILMRGLEKAAGAGNLRAANEIQGLLAEFED